MEWDKLIQQTFVNIKATLAAAMLLHHPLYNAITTLTTDASNVGVRTVLKQCISNHWQQLALFSWKFLSSERNYLAFERELLAVHSPI